MKFTTLLAASTFLLQDSSVSAFSALPRGLVTGPATTTTPISSSSLQMLGGGPKTKRIERSWTYVDDKGEEYKSGGKMKAKIFLPKDGTTVKGCAFFMHGFSQYTKAYSDTLQKVSDSAGIAVVSVDTGITSILGDVITNPFGPNPQFVLQRKLSEDTKQCIQMILDGSEEFEEFGIGKNVPMGVCGHSMGGGLSFPVAAAFPNINYVFTMAPVPGEPEFDSIIKGVDVRTVKNSMLLAGSKDCIGKAKKVKEISTASNEKKRDSSIFVEISGGTHTGFEDELVITNLSLDTILRAIFGPFSAIENIILFLIKWCRESAGQLEGSEILMEYFFGQMTTGKKVTVANAQKVLDNSDMTEKNIKKFDITLG